MNSAMKPAVPLRRSAVCFIFAALATLWLFPAHAASQDRSLRLILKDGSYQSVTKYEVKGDRVRYLSAERNEWEELPSSLVDWPATEKYEKDRAAAGPSVPEAVELDKELKAESDLGEARHPQVAPGLRLPEDSGVFLLDNFKGEPQLNDIQQTAGDLNRKTKGNIFRGGINPASSSKMTIELDGEHAPVQSHTNVPSLYLKPDDAPEPSDMAQQPKDSTAKNPNSTPQSPQSPQQPQQPFDRFRIVRAQTTKGKRILGDVKRNLTGKTSQEQQFVKTTVDRITGGWLKITPTESLAPGEYALVEMMGKEGMNLYVWDFGVNPTAPPNANPWKPEPK